MTSTPDADETRRDLQPHVQRLLGRCLLRIQQYERLAKVILAQHEFAGPVDAIEQQLAARVDKFSDQSLGTLVKALFKTYVVPDGFERELLQEGQTPTDRIAIAFSVRTSMTPEDRGKTKAAVEDFGGGSAHDRAAHAGADVPRYACRWHRT